MAKPRPKNRNKKYNPENKRTLCSLHGFNVLMSKKPFSERIEQNLKFSDTYYTARDNIFSGKGSRLDVGVMIMLANLTISIMQIIMKKHNDHSITAEVKDDLVDCCDTIKKIKNIFIEKCNNEKCEFLPIPSYDDREKIDKLIDYVEAAKDIITSNDMELAILNVEKVLGKGYIHLYDF